MPDSLASRLPAFARALLSAQDFRQLLDVTQAEARDALGYAHAWLFVGDKEAPDEVRIVDMSSEHRDRVWELIPTLRVAGDRMMEEIVHGNRVVVVEDARTDPRTDKAIVASLGNRTIINVPLRLLDKPFGAMGVGTFGEEGCRPPSPEALDHLVGMAGQLSVAASRIRFVEERLQAERQKMELERRLLHMQKLESLGMLASGIAHDFNNLLTIISGSAGIARARLPEGAASAELDAVLDAARRANQLTRQLTGMSSRRAPREELLDVNAQLDRLLLLLRRLMPADVIVTTRFRNDLGPVLGDASGLDQVFMNLCINARDAMPGGGHLVVSTDLVDVTARELETHPEVGPGRFALVSVRDSGMGMTDDVAGQMFDPFFTTKASAGGTGLGLAIVHGIVARHHGLVRYTTAPGAGTTFEVLLPLAVGGTEADAPGRAEAGRGASGRA